MFYDALISYLLTVSQLQNPCLATPSAIAQHQITVPVSNENTQNVVEWLEKLTTSFNPDVQASSGTVESPESFTFAPHPKNIAYDIDPDGGGTPMIVGENARGNDENLVSY